MELRNRLAGALGTAALLMGMTAGIVSAGTPSESSIGASVFVNCPEPASVTLSTASESDTVVFEQVDILEEDSTSTAPGEIIVTVDMGCYLGNWQVNASITRFEGPVMSFPGSHFSLEDATVESYFTDPIDTPLDFGEPEASDAEFSPIAGPPSGDAGSDNAIFETRFSFLFWLFFGQDIPAPFESVASYTGVLSDLPFLLGGDYEATLTVELTLD